MITRTLTIAINTILGFFQHCMAWLDHGFGAKGPHTCGSDLVSPYILIQIRVVSNPQWNVALYKTLYGETYKQLSSATTLVLGSMTKFKVECHKVYGCQSHKGMGDERGQILGDDGWFTDIGILSLNVLGSQRHLKCSSLNVGSLCIGGLGDIEFEI